jgi:hypothetical protein
MDKLRSIVSRQQQNATGSSSVASARVTPSQTAVSAAPPEVAQQLAPRPEKPERATAPATVPSAATSTGQPKAVAVATLLQPEVYGPIQGTTGLQKPITRKSATPRKRVAGYTRRADWAPPYYLRGSSSAAGYPTRSSAPTRFSAKEFWNRSRSTGM